MNLTDTFLSENENFKYISVVFSPYTGSKEYTYKTLLDIKEEDFVVVHTPSGKYEVVQVRQVMPPMEALVSPDITYKWVVQKVNLDKYQESVEMEQELRRKLRTAEVRKRREELKESAMTFLSEEERSETIKLVRL